MIRSAEICPYHMVKSCPRQEWLHSDEWFVSDDYIRGQELSYKEWHTYHRGEDSICGSSPYSGLLVGPVSEAIVHCML